MKKCAKCDTEYDDAYDGCPACAKAAVAQAPTAPSVAAKATGSVGAAFVALVLALITWAVIPQMVGDTTAGVITWLCLWAAIVVVDASAMRKPIRADYKMPAGLGYHPTVWGLLVLLLAIVTIPVYFYSRPKIKQAYELGALPS
jgi:predicted transporter